MKTYIPPYADIIHNAWDLNEHSIDNSNRRHDSFIVARQPDAQFGYFNTNQFALTSSNTFTGNQTIIGNINIDGDIFANNFVTSSTLLFTGSTNHGSHIEDVHTYTGSVYITGSLNVIGNINGVINSTNGVVSSSAQITSFGFVSGSYETTGRSIISSSAQITAFGFISSSTTIDTGSFNSIGFNTSAGVSVGVGELAWNNTDGTLDLGMKGGNVVQQIGQEIFYEVRNETGIQIPNGTAVYANGVTAGSGRITAAPYVADGSIRENRFLGIATENISTGVNGFVTHFGYVRDLDTRGTTASSIAVGDETWAVGDILYVHPTVSGKLTKVKPQHEITVAIIIARHQSAGVIFVRPTSNGHLGDIHDISINTGSLSNGQVLSYNSTSGVWENTNTISGSFATTGSNLFRGDQTITGSLFISGTTELGGDLVPKFPSGSTLGTSERPFKGIFVSSGSINIASDIIGDPNTTLSNVGGNILISAGGMRLVEPGNSFIAETGSFQYISGSMTQVGDYTQTGNYVMVGDKTISGSLKISGSGFINNRRILTDLDTGSFLTSLNGAISSSAQITALGFISSSQTINTASFATTGSNTFRGDETISGSLTLSSGSALNINDGFYVNGNKQFNYGQFSDLTIQSASANTAYPMKLNTTDVSAGVSIVSGSRVTVANTGIYNLQFSTQLEQTSNNAAEVSIWLRKDGTDIPNSNTELTIEKISGGGKLVAAWNYMVQLNANQYVQLMWCSTRSDTQLHYHGTQSTPTRPATPSVIATITQIA
jgi:hypothetical protein